MLSHVGCLSRLNPRCAGEGAVTMDIRSLNRIEAAARASLFRAMGFATLAIMTVMIGLSYDPPAALKSGGILFAIAALVLIWKAETAETSDYRRTEVYLLLDGDLDLDPREAQSAIGSLLRRVYRRAAQYSVYAAAGLGLASFLF